MNGEPLANAKAAADPARRELVDASDAFTIVDVLVGRETVVPHGARDRRREGRARIDAIAKIWDDGNTCISCGIDRGAERARRARRSRAACAAWC